jgi:uncharacterized protein
MVTSGAGSRAAAEPRARTSAVAAVLALVMTAGGLVMYKASSALGVLAKADSERALHPKSPWLDADQHTAATRPLIDSLNYLSWVAIALVFGILIAASVRAFVPARWLERTVGADGIRGQLVAALVGAPLMLCSCCIAPVFEGVYARTRRLGPSLAIMLASPALNPAVLAATFLIFPARIGALRVAAALALVVIAAAVLARAFRDPRALEACALEQEPPLPAAFGRAFARSLGAVAWRSLPAILIGVILSMVITGWLPLQSIANLQVPAAVVIVVVSLVAVPLALPTFGEIPLALLLLSAGAPPGAAAAVLIAGPTVNLPSLLSLAHATSWRVALATAATVFGTALAVGLLAQGIW